MKKIRGGNQMKKEKIKSILILSIVSILLIMLTGCGTTKEKNEEEKSNNTSNNEQSNEAKQDEEVTTNVAEFVKYKDATYFWKLSANSRENTGLFAKYSTNQNTKNELSLQTDSNGGMFGVVLSGITTTEPGLSSAPVQSFTVIFKDFSAICMKYIDIQAIPYVNIVCAANTARTTTSVTSTLLCGGLPAFESATGFTATGTNAIVTAYALSVTNGEATLTMTLSTGQAGSDTVTLVDAAGVDIFAPFDVIWS